MILEGKVALITGAGSGIGRATALRLAEEGAEVVAADLRLENARATADEVAALGRRSRAVQVDVTRLPALHAMVDSSLEAFGRIDILVTCAGIVQQSKMLQLQESDWDRMFAVNAKGTFFTIQAVAPQMILQESGAIVTLSSSAGRGPRPTYIHYGASKAAVISITQSVAAELAPHGIRVNALCPGIIETPMWDQIDREMFAEYGIPMGEFRKQRLQRVPMGRIGTAEEVADAVLFLVSPRASYITGQALNINGGSLMS